MNKLHRARLPSWRPVDLLIGGRTSPLSDSGLSGVDADRLAVSRAQDAFVKRWNALHAIRVAAIAWRDGSPAPRTVNAIGLSVLTFLVTVLVLPQVFLQLLPGVSQVWSYIASPFLSAGLASVVCSLVISRSSAPATHIQHLDNLLSAYDPASPDAFIAFQNLVLETRSFNPAVVLEWIAAEQKALHSAAGWRITSDSRSTGTRWAFPASMFGRFHAGL